MVLSQKPTGRSCVAAFLLGVYVRLTMVRIKRRLSLEHAANIDPYSYAAFGAVILVNADPSLISKFKLYNFTYSI